MRESMASLFSEADLPRSCYYGDGSLIDDSTIERISEVYRGAAVAVQWHIGDVLMVDNMLVAHARQPYQGSRKILVAMGEMMRKPENPASNSIHFPMAV